MYKRQVVDAGLKCCTEALLLADAVGMEMCIRDRLCFGTIAHTICDYLGVDASTLDGQSVLGDILA